MKVLVTLSAAALGLAFAQSAHAAPEGLVQPSVQDNAVQTVDYSSRRSSANDCMYGNAGGGKARPEKSGMIDDAHETDWVCGGGSGGSGIGTAGGGVSTGGASGGGGGGGSGGGGGGGGGSAGGGDSGASGKYAGGSDPVHGTPPGGASTGGSGGGYNGGSGSGGGSGMGGGSGSGGNGVSHSAPGPILGLGLPAFAVAGGYVFFRRRIRKR